jgi:integrase
MTDRLARVGLVRARESVLLGEFLDGYIAGRTDVKPRTRIKYNATKDYLVHHFGANSNLRHITAGDAGDWRRWLAEKVMAENTIRKHITIAKTFFGYAVAKSLIDRNPFSGQKSGTQAVPERFHFVTLQDAEKCLQACPDAEWRLIFALSRFGGLRCPSEHLALSWDCVDWENSRLRIRSPKTEHHQGKAERIIPLFPELRPYLEAVFDEAAEGTVHVITRYRDANQNLRTQLCRIIERAGLTPWPKLFQNLRSTRETELAEEYPLHVVTAWLGNSRAVATKHYLQVTEDHFAKATQKATQTVHDSGCQGGIAPSTAVRKSFPVNVGQQCTSVQVAGAGLEPARP